MTRHNNNHLPTISVDCEVTANDFAEMEYCHESGMFDITTKNPLALALKRKIAPGHKVQVRREIGENYRYYIDGEYGHELEGVEELMECANQGIYLYGYHFQTELPKRYLPPAPLSLHPKSEVTQRETAAC